MPASKTAASKTWSLGSLKSVHFSSHGHPHGLGGWLIASNVVSTFLGEATACLPSQTIHIGHILASDEWQF